MAVFGYLINDQRGAAAAEMALITPLLMTLVFGSFELGHYFWNEHKVVKGVRDGARYAGRQNFNKFDCSSVLDSVVETNIKNVTRTGKLSGGTPRVAGWGNVSTDVTVTVNCDVGTTTGIYKGKAGGAPRVTVAADVAYPSLFETLGFSASSLKLKASSQAAVMGL